MRTGGFRFAVVLSLALAAAAVASRSTYHLPLRDPDGVAVPTYVRLPIILLLAFLTDVRARGRSVAGPAGRPRQAAPHPGRGDPRALALGPRPVRAGRARRVVPHLRGLPEPQELRAVREPRPLGLHPRAPRPGAVARATTRRRVLHSVFGIGWAAHFFSFVYVAWIVFVPVSLVVALVWSRDRAGGAWYVTAVAVDWVLGVATYFAVPTLGPGLRRSRRTSRRCRTPTSRRCRSR